MIETYLEHIGVRRPPLQAAPPKPVSQLTGIQSVARWKQALGLDLRAAVDTGDGAEGRHLLNRLATFYSLPYIDVGVRLEADGHGGIRQICGSVHWLRPGGSSLLSRGVITLETVRAEGLRRRAPGVYQRLRKEKYIKGVDEERPAVISVNTLFSSLAACELLARLHPFRDDDNAEYARLTISLTQLRFESAVDGPPCPALARHVGRGDVAPLLDDPELSEVAPCARSA